MKGLEALEELKFQVGNITYHTRDLQITTFKVRDSGLFETIEKELKQAEEDRKALNIFKNALTIEHHEYPTIEPNDSEDAVSYLVKELYTIKQNELKKDMRKALREWVLKNAFPKELKALNEILALHNKWLGNEMSDFEFFTLLSEVKEKYGLSKEVLL